MVCLPSILVWQERIMAAITGQWSVLVEATGVHYDKTLGFTKEVSNYI